MLLQDPFKTPSIQAAATDNEYFQDMKSRIHRRLIDRIDLAKMDLMGNSEVLKEIGSVIENLIIGEGIPLNQMERDRLIVEIQHETFGLLEPLLADYSRSRTSWSTTAPKGLHLERVENCRRPTSDCFRDNAHLMQIIERIVSKVGRRIDESSPYAGCEAAG